ncbi:oligopeptide/dipeptide ABC transporter ATP-binding protein [Paenibacillus sp. FSL K6-1318]|uniref:ABC transporter ATP-binding protein n=1 Tax=Paenibacillus sp. FSL K6-1318 TaxID=2975291 RepID=UPI0030ED5E98
MTTLNSQTRSQEPLLQITGLRTYYSIKSKTSYRKQQVKAVDDVSLNIYEGETYGLVGESGCGKSTLGKTVLRLLSSQDGEIRYRGQPIHRLSRRRMRAYRQEIQMIFQDPYSSLNPRITVGEALEEALVIHRIGKPEERTRSALKMLQAVGLQDEHYYSLPHQLSGGQRQRIGLARALILNPKLVICDEPVSALDVIIQAQIINLMRKLQREMDLTYLFIAHDIAVVRHISDRIGVMYLGKLVEEADTESLFHSPRHPYTQLLLSAVPIPDPSMKRLSVVTDTDMPSPLETISGCAFHTRCPLADEQCRSIVPVKRVVKGGHWVACHHAAKGIDEQ